MFTGIIQKVGDVVRYEKADASSRLWVRSDFENLQLGESIAINGVCLTLAEFNPQGEMLFFLSRETIERTSLGFLTSGSKANLERAATLGTSLSGHWVQGHVDGLAKCVHVSEVGGSHLVEFDLPKELIRFCVEKGSIALDGVSLTSNSVSDDGRISLMLIPHTWNHTCFSGLKTDDCVNVEVDILSKYVAKHMERLCQSLKR